MVKRDGWLNDFPGSLAHQPQGLAHLHIAGRVINAPALLQRETKDGLLHRQPWQILAIGKNAFAGLIGERSVEDLRLGLWFCRRFFRRFFCRSDAGLNSGLSAGFSAVLGVGLAIDSAGCLIAKLIGTGAGDGLNAPTSGLGLKRGTTTGFDRQAA